MNKKSLLGLILFASIVIAGMFLTTELLINQSNKANTSIDQTRLTEEDSTGDKTANTDKKENISKDSTVNSYSSKITPTEAADNASITQEASAGFVTNTTTDITEGEPWLSANPSDTDTSGDSLAASSAAAAKPQLIYDSTEVDYQAYIPMMQYDSDLKAALNISNPDIDIDAEAAILFDADTKQVLYYKNPVKAVFPASTLKLLTSIVALNWCSVDEEVTIGDEITMIASDSTRAYLKQGQILTIRNLLEGMLLPSGNDAAYAVAAYVGRKSLYNLQASKEEAVTEFVRLMNAQAKEIGVKNSCFKTPDGYDAVGQYTTAYDMGLIGIAAAGFDTITEIAHKSSSRNSFVSGEDVTWNNTNKLITRFSGKYYSPTIGLKTGTSTMAGRCIITAAKKDGKEVICAIMDSTAVGRWEDAIALMKYGLE
ncbi:MAG: serine hydrolase [Herbinix sp.]|nr:serine hydrolase [Herbinix sp.]